MTNNSIVCQVIITFKELKNIKKIRQHSLDQLNIHSNWIIPSMFQQLIFIQGFVYSDLLCWIIFYAVLMLTFGMMTRTSIWKSTSWLIIIAFITHVVFIIVFDIVVVVFVVVVLVAIITIIAVFVLLFLYIIFCCFVFPPLFVSISIALLPSVLSISLCNILALLQASRSSVATLLFLTGVDLNDCGVMLLFSLFTLVFLSCMNTLLLLALFAADMCCSHHKYTTHDWDDANVLQHLAKQCRIVIWSTVQLYTN